MPESEKKTLPISHLGMGARTCSDCGKKLLVGEPDVTIQDTNVWCDKCAPNH